MKKALPAILLSAVMLCSCSRIQNYYSSLFDEIGQMRENITGSDREETSEEEETYETEELFETEEVYETSTDDYILSEGSDEQTLSDSIAIEISYALEQNTEAENKLYNEALTQWEMNVAADELYRLWDDTLNNVWAILEEGLSEEDMAALREEEQEWIEYKEAQIDEAGAEYEGGSMQPMVRAMEGAELTKARVYDLAAYADGK
ncbi:MAG: DUF1311 domain-containing protein [Clostridiales bacterium]|nr:DUF1311 domain-containing protein [Clostridiales bacterium]